MKTTLYLARHGETHWNKQQRFQGQLDSELTEQGKVQSQALAKQLTDKAIDGIISSSLGRASATAAICQQWLGVESYIDKNLDERHLGDWQGEHLKVIKSQPDYYETLNEFTEIAPNGGESAVKCGERLFKALKNIALTSQNKKLLVIFHGEALRCFLWFLGQRCEGNAYQLFENGALHELSYLHHSAEFKIGHR